MGTMLSDSFTRLPEDVQQFVLEGLDEEIQQGFQDSEAAKVDTSVSEDKMRQIADGIVRSLALRNAFTGEELSEQQI